MTARDVLAERARALARPLARGQAGTPDDADAATAIDAVIVRAGASTYAVPLADVVEILRATRLTPLPGAAPPVIGVVPWRGRVLAVLALDGRAPNAIDGRAPNAAGSAAPDAAGGAATRVVVAGDVRAPIAIVVDEVDGVRRLPVVLAADDDTRAAAVPTRGVTPDAVAVLDVAALGRRVAAANDS